METFTVQQLKEELKRRHLPTSGNKQLLQSRLEEAMDAELEGQAVTTPKVVADSTSMDTPTPLYSDWKLVQMKTELRRRKLPISGTKSQLIDRLVYSDTNSSVGTQSPMPAQPAVERKQPPKSAKKSKEIDVVIPTSMTPSGKDASLANYPTAIVKPATMQSLVDDDEEDEMNAELRIWSSPLKTIWYFGAGMKDLGVDAIVYAAGHRITISLLIVASILAYAGYTTDNPYQQVFRKAESNILWYGYWVLLGVASSIGLGTGLHTFVLFLGPFIAKVAVVAQECGSLDFAVHGPNAFNCEENDYFSDISLGAIYSKVLFESFAWGAGTAIGELPPYFVARAAALAGQQDKEFDHIEEIKQKPSSSRSLWEKVQVFMFTLMQRLGFWGILLSASIPNPLFDLAGITCGHFLVPFSTFFGATFVGKAAIKAAMQTWFIILIFSKKSLQWLLAFLQKHSTYLHDQVKEILFHQKLKFETVSSDAGSHQHNPTGLLAVAWNSLIGVMIAYFLLSIVHSVASSKLKREQKKNK